MVIKRGSNGRRGMGRERFEEMLKARPAKKLVDGDHLLFHHALRCLCQYCGRLLDWDCPEDISFIITECCGVKYSLQPWTVKVITEDVSSRPILPKMKGSNYSDPNIDFTSQMGDLNIKPVIIKSRLSAAQRALGSSSPAPTPQEPRTWVIPAGWPKPPQKLIPAPKKPKKSVRKCSICRELGHDKRKCPKA